MVRDHLPIQTLWIYDQINISIFDNFILSKIHISPYSIMLFNIRLCFNRLKKTKKKHNKFVCYYILKVNLNIEYIYTFRYILQMVYVLML